VPTPPRGYWAKLAAGQKVKKTIFAEVKDPAIDIVEIHGAMDRLPPAVRETIERYRTERRVAERPKVEPAPATAEAKPLPELHPAIRATAKALRAVGRKDHSTAIGDGLCGVNVGLATVERAIAILDDLASRLDTRSLPLRAAGKSMQVQAGPDQATFTLSEVTRPVAYTPTDAELAEEQRRLARLERYHRGHIRWDDAMSHRAYPAMVTQWTGQLVLQIEGYSDGVRRKWADGKHQRLETVLADFVDGLGVLLAARKASRELREERERKWAERQRREGLSKGRKERERARLAFVESSIAAQQEIDRLEAWLTKAGACGQHGTDAQFGRMLKWARDHLAALKLSMQPEAIEVRLAAAKLFPALEADELHDPLGEPDPKKNWWD
jgi:hypothetical protein